jgi:hypothetical protein
MSHEGTIEVVQLESTLIQSTKLAFKLGAPELKSSTCQARTLSKALLNGFLGMATMIISQHASRRERYEIESTYDPTPSEATLVSR